MGCGTPDWLRREEATNQRLTLWLCFVLYPSPNSSLSLLPPPPIHPPITIDIDAHEVRRTSSSVPHSFHCRDMSLDVTSYWQPAALTANGLIRYEADEVALYCTQTAHVDIECGGDGAKHTYKAGHAHVTSHRIVWVRERSASGAQTAAAASSSPATAAAVCLPLDAVERVEQKVSVRES